MLSLNKKGEMPREIYMFGILIIFILFGTLYAGIGNTLYSLNGNNLPELDERGYSIPKLDNDDNGGIGSFVIKGIKGYSESNLSWINYIFAIFLALLIVMGVILILHG